MEALIGPETINTMPRKTRDAYRDHGGPGARLETELEASRRVLADLAGVGIDIDQITMQLQKEGIDKFIKPYDSLMETLRQERAEALG